MGNVLAAVGKEVPFFLSFSEIIRAHHTMNLTGKGLNVILS